MCTAIRFNDRLFGRTLDVEKSYGEELIVTPRGRMRIGESENRYAIMGIGVMMGDTPLYFDGVNEWGLCAAALNFPGCAVYGGSDKKAELSSGHLISLILGLCRNCEEARDMLSNIGISGEGVNGSTPPAPLHWMLSDPRGSLAVEPLADGLSAVENSAGVLANSPELSYQLNRLCDIGHLSAKNPKADMYSRGLGAVGLPGDFSSSSRFLRAAFLKENCPISDSTAGGVGQALDILASLSIPRGAVLGDNGLPMYTRYTAIVDMAGPAYYLTTSACRAVRSLSLSDPLAQGREIVRYPIYHEQTVEKL